jgi:hypothetical protein
MELVLAGCLEERNGALHIACDGFCWPERLRDVRSRLIVEGISGWDELFWRDPTVLRDSRTKAVAELLDGRSWSLQHHWIWKMLRSPSRLGELTCCGRSEILDEVETEIRRSDLGFRPVGVRVFGIQALLQLYSGVLTLELVRQYERRLAEAGDFYSSRQAQAVGAVLRGVLSALVVRAALCVGPDLVAAELATRDVDG